MAINTKTSYVLPEILKEAIESAVETAAAADGVAGGGGMSKMAMTGAAIINTNASFGEGDVGNTVDIPYFAALGAFEDVADGVALAVADHSQTKETATVVRSGKAFQMTDWAQTGKSDPYADAANQLVGGYLRRIDRLLIERALDTDAPMTLDYYDDVAAGTTAPRGLDYSTFVAARGLFADEQEDIAALVVRSEVLMQMFQLVDTQNRPLLIQSARSGEPPMFHGVPVFTTDRLPVTAGSTITQRSMYTSLLLKRNSLTAWINGSPTVETDRDILTASDVAAVNFYHAGHKYLHMPGARKAGVVIVEHNLITGFDDDGGTAT